MVLPGEDATDLQRPSNVLPLLAKWVPQDAVEVERSAVYAFHGLLAETWRAGRILLAGDAAHQMPPFLGQGMNSGLRDAANLAWKLSMVVRGEAQVAILDTYELERSPHVARVIAAAIDYGRLTCTIDPEAAAERDRRWREDRRHVTDRLPFSLPALDQGPLVLDGGGELFIQPAIPGPIGRLDDVVGQRFLVVGRNENSFGGERGWWNKVVGALVATVDELRDPLDELERWMNRRSADVVVVRPDRYVMAAGVDLNVTTARVAHFFRGSQVTKSTPVVIG
jgi:3-(3-hydroxy-phenyl)propionate hydroxylase